MFCFPSANAEVRMADGAGKRTDIELLERSAAGEETAFNALYDRHQQAVYRFALYCGGSAELAEEITQEVFLLLIRAPQQYDTARGSSLLAYLCGVARNRLREHWKRDHVMVPLDEDEHGQPPTECEGALGDLTSREALAALRQAVHALPLRYREVVVLCHLQGLGYREAAAILECAEGTVCSRLNRARALPGRQIERLWSMSNLSEDERQLIRGLEALANVDECAPREVRARSRAEFRRKAHWHRSFPSIPNPLARE
jgi:RNA polymerase sigma-70 factor (ECF subfamily)